MKRNTFTPLIVLSLTFIICLMGCSQNNTVVEMGSLELNIDSAGMRGIQAVSMETASYNVTVKNSAGVVVLDYSNSTRTSYTVSVPAGYYTADVEALNRDGDVIGEGHATAEVRNGQTNRLSVVVTELQGMGTVSMEISGNEGESLTYCFLDAGLGEVSEGNLAYTDGAYRATIDLQNGFYTIILSCGENQLAVETVRVINGKTVVYRANVTTTEEGVLTIENVILKTPEIIVKIGRTAYSKEDTLRATAEIEGIEGSMFCWVIDGKELEITDSYSDLEYALEDTKIGEHSVALFISDGTVIWSQKTEFQVTSEQITSMSVCGDLEIWLVGDVLIPTNMSVDVEIGQKHLTLRRTRSHQVYYVPSESTISCSLSRDDYSYYLIGDFDQVNGRTVVYVVIDKFIKDPAYLRIVFPDKPILSDTEYASFVYTGEKTILDGSQSGYSQRQGFVTLTNDRSPRQIKVNPDTYWTGGYSYSVDEAFEFIRDNARQSVNAGETVIFNIDVVEYSTFITADLTEMVADETFSEMANSIALYVGDKVIGSWGSSLYFNHWPDSQTRGTNTFGNDLPVKAVITLKSGISEEDFPYMIVPDISTITVEEGKSYIIRFRTVNTNESEPDESKTQLKVLNYIDRSEPNSANEIAQVWDKFTAEHPDIVIVREDLFNEPFHQKTEAYAAQGDLPDVLYVWPSGRSTTLHTEHLLYDLEPLLRRDGLYDAYAATCTAPQIGGYLGELPNGLTATSMMFVNEKVLRENGLEIPKTYDDLKAMVPVLNAKGIEVITMDCQDSWVMQSCLFSLITGRFGGADWADKLAAGEWDFEDDWFKKALTVVDNLYKDGIINRNTLSISYGSGRGDFAAGKSAFYIDGDWACASFQTDSSTGNALFPPELQKTDISLMNFPALDGEVIHESNSAIVGTGWAISADIAPEKLEAAWTLVKYLEGEYVQTWRLTTGAAFPSLTSIDVAKVCEENNLEPLVAKRSEWYSDIQVVTPIIDGVLDPSVYEVINQVLAEIGLGRTTVDQAARSVNAAWHAYTGDNN